MKKHLSFIILTSILLLIIALVSSFIYVVNDHAKKQVEEENIENAIELLNLDVEELSFDCSDPDKIILYEKGVGDDSYYNYHYRLFLEYDKDHDVHKVMFTLLPGEIITYENYDYGLVIAFMPYVNPSAPEVDQNLVHVINVLMRTFVTDTGYYIYFTDNTLPGENVELYISSSLNDISKLINYNKNNKE